MLNRRHLLVAAAFGAASSNAATAFAQSAYPSRPIRVVLPVPAGGQMSAMLRPLQDAIHQTLGQPVVVDYKPGASGAIGTLEVARAQPDGHTLGFVWNGPMGLAPVLRPSLGYDPVQDFAAVTVVARAPGVIIANGAMPNDLASFIAYVKSQPPGTVGCANAGLDTAGHLWARQLAQKAGIELLHVPFKNTNEAVPALVAGDVKIIFSSTSSMINGLVRDKRLKFLAVASTSPSPLLPGVELVSKTVPGVVGEAWYGLVAPKGTPTEITHRLQQIVARQLQDPATRRIYFDTSCEPVGSTVEQMAEVIRRERPYWQEIARGVKTS